MAGTLHQLLSADPRAVAECLAIVQPGDRLFLADGGVLLLGSSWSELGEEIRPDCRFVASRPDVLARGFEAQAGAQAIDLADDADWVSLVVSSDRVLSWK